VSNLVRLIPESWLPSAPIGSLKRVIFHWTAGTYTPNGLELSHYHFLVDGQGKLHRGTHSVLANVLIKPGAPYAAHTKGCNTGSIGIAACCMRGAEERPFKAGAFPMLELQWSRMAEAVAEICKAYGIPVEPRSVLAHGEVEKGLGIKQNWKWDPLARPWVSRPLEGAGEDFRVRVRLTLAVMEKEAASVSG
jgi:N-acetyl-anhydromuramyl-L-alanine amidase AmpD